MSHYQAPPSYAPQYGELPLQQYVAPQQYMPVAQTHVQPKAHPLSKHPYTEIDALRNTGTLCSIGECQMAICPPLTHCCRCMSLRIGMMLLAAFDVLIGSFWTTIFTSIWILTSGSKHARGMSFVLFPMLPTFLYTLTAILGVVGACEKSSGMIFIYLSGVVFSIILFAIYAWTSLQWYDFLNWGIMVSMAWWKLIVGAAFLREIKVSKNNKTVTFQGQMEQEMMPPQAQQGFLQNQGYGYDPNQPQYHVSPYNQNQPTAAQSYNQPPCNPNYHPTAAQRY